MQLGIGLTENQLDQLMCYLEELKKWSKRINLIARETSDEKIIENHFIDSLSLLSILNDYPGSLVDVGTGAGFPGMVLAVAQPQRHFILIEPRKKRVSFLNHIKRILKLENVAIIGSRLEECITKEIFNDVRYVTSRAVAAPDIFLPMIAPLLFKGAEAILMLAKKEKVSDIKAVAESCQVTVCKSFTLPYSNATRTLVRVAV